MDIQVRTDYHVNGEQALIEFVQDEVAAGLDAYADRITSVQVHLTEESGAHKAPYDFRCMVEVRPTGHEPVAVRNRAATKDDAVRGAVDQMYGVLTRLYGRLDQRHPGAETIRGRG